MNLILLNQDDFVAANSVVLSGRRFKHAQEVLKTDVGRQLTVGLVNGSMGRAEVLAKKADSLELAVALDQEPPPALALTLVLALQRPPMLKRMLFAAAMLGIKKIIILNFNRVEKSLWNSSALKPAAIEEQLVLGLEQAKDTVMPEVVLKKRFKPFVEDELPALVKGRLALVAHPGGGELPTGVIRPVILVIGPEGGILDFEIDLLESAGCRTVDLGQRILRTESVLPLVVGKLF
ncbi:MAG: 16S rRNA (uracil(1498)-N(3))-methyltransferase [Candidatus Omnitrophica bacterium]|nr:16S rRNA (uracil(1498)-N(3))-methyltransferase [Candidatus Omnitrophota bacterium]MDE2223140.1 16S rRNA (uracil(1498)-N(3))-methyltransferase [Candidatus Omnitrophota bacterium]